MLNLFDYLTPLDNRRIENYISLYGINRDGYIGNEKYLKYWAESKKHLFHLLGGNLIYKFPIHFQKPKQQLANDCNALGFFTSLFFDRINRKEFREVASQDTILGCRALTWTETLADDAIPYTIKAKLPDAKKMLQLQKGMKPIKAIQKIIDYFGWDDLKESFEEFRIKHSQIFNTKDITGNMCLSIHPLDFMTMSDNASGWSSCMTWTERGCYHVGTVEMMNSNNVICCYVEGSDSYYFQRSDKEETKEEYTWNNKKWRQLFYVTKEIAVCGKAYPYQSKEFSVAALNKIKELTEKNLHRSYQFGIEPYRDMNYIGSNFRMSQNKEWIRSKQTTKHNIIFDSKGMYNDMFNDHDGSEDIYWCFRNKVKKNIVISYSGKAPCLCCGKSVIQQSMTALDANYDGAYNDRYSNVGNVICDSCLDDHFTCDYCESRVPTRKLIRYKGKTYCERCWNDHALICPDCGEIFLNNCSGTEILWGRTVDAQLYQQDFRFYGYDDCGHDRKVIPMDVCLSCKEKKKKTEFIKITPPFNKSEVRYSWISPKEYYVSKEVINPEGEENSKYFLNQLHRAKEA
jgi:ribosomal protein S14